MRFNAPVATRHKTVNRAGGEAFTPGSRLELASLVLTSFVQDQFYRSAGETLKQVADLTAADPYYAAQAATLARHEYGMRSISHAIAGEVAARVKGETWTRHFFEAVIRRPDDVTEALAYYRARHGKAIPNAMKKGFGAALAKFDAYQLGKYQAKSAAFSLVDAVNLCHPPHTDALAALVNGTLAAPDTWEVKLTQAGQAGDKDAAKAEAWGELVTGRKIGYFALLRNLRNIYEQAPDTVPAALEMLVDEKLIRNSLVLPFRYQTALAEIGRLPGATAIVQALARAVDLSLANVPKMEGRTVVIVDGSGSMGGKPIEIASLFAAVLVKANAADLITFSTDAAYKTLNPSDSALTLAGQIRQGLAYGGTDFHAPFRVMTRPYDRMIWLSDMQGWIGYTAPTADLVAYEKAHGVRPHVYSFDLQGYGTLQWPKDRLYCMAGFSEKVFEIMPLLEEDRHALVHRIEAVTFG